MMKTYLKRAFQLSDSGVILSLLCFFCTADDLCFSVCRQAVEWKYRETGGISPVYAGSDPGDVLSY